MKRKYGREVIEIRVDDTGVSEELTPNSELWDRVKKCFNSKDILLVIKDASDYVWSGIATQGSFTGTITLTIPVLADDGTGVWICGIAINNGYLAYFVGDYPISNR